MASFIDQFSIGFIFRKDKSKKPKIYNFEKKNKLFRTKTFTKKGNLSAQLAHNLISLGYSLDSIMCLIKIHNFSNVEEALNLLEKDPISKLYNHYFFESKKNYFSQDSKSDDIVIKVNNKSKNKRNKGDEDRCRICDGTREEHINEKDEFNKELIKARKEYEKDQYYECESTNVNIKEKNKMQIKVLERVKTMGNNLNLNKDKDKYLILNLNQNVHKYYMNNKNNKDNSQSPMLLLHNSKTQIINKINDLSFINKQSRNKSNSIKIPINNEKEETQEIDSLTKNQISKLISESKMELNQDEQNEEDNQINSL